MIIMKNVFKVALSDTIKIPDFSQSVYKSTATSTSASKLVDSTGNFQTTVNVGDRVYNIDDATIATVTAIDSDTQLSLSADIMASGELYSIHRFDVSKGYRLFVGGTGNINCITAGGNKIVINGVPVGMTEFEVVQVRSTSTTASNIYVVF